MKIEEKHRAERIRYLWDEFLYQSSPGTHTYVVGGCKCGSGTRGGRSRCPSCIADLLLTEYGIDVTKPQWGRDEGNRIKRLWAVEWVCDELMKEERSGT